MTAKEFTFWLRGYLKAIKPGNDLIEIVKTIEEQLDLVDKKEIDLADDIAEKMWEDFAKRNPIYPQYPQYPYPYIPEQPIVVMYGCNQITTTYDNPDITTTLTVSSHTINKKETNEN